MTEKLSILEQITYCTARIETQDSMGNKYCGSGFFFNLEKDNFVAPILVTNKHVVANMENGYFIFNEADDEGNPIPTKQVVIEYNGNFVSKWILHPSPEVDLCVLPLRGVLNKVASINKRIFYRTLDGSFIPTKEQTAKLDVMEDIIMVGYPNGLCDSVNNRPIIRKGITATQYCFDYNGKKEFVIDAACFPGSSGSPVLICNIGSITDKFGTVSLGGSRVYLLGILYAGPQLTVEGDIKVVTIPNLQQKPISVAHIPNNLGYVIKSERLLEFIPLIFK